MVSAPEQSEALLAELVAFEEALFADLGLHFKVLVRASSRVAWQLRPALQGLGVCPV